MRRSGACILIFCCLFPVLICAQAEPASPAFDGSSAFSCLRDLVEIGPRPPDSPGSDRTQAYIMNELARRGVEVREQQFTAVTPLGRKRMENIVGIIPGAADEVIIIGAHYDTKLIESFHFVGANDGASGVAVLLELARVLPALNKPATVWLVFFDGEEALYQWSDTDGLYGSRHMAEELTKSGEISKVKAMVLLDMVGDSHLSIEAEANSTKWLRKIVREKAGKLGYGAQFAGRSERITDDHVPFLQHGIPALDIIDFHYGPNSQTNEFWHSPKDTLENVSPRSLKIVGDVVLESLPEIARHLKSAGRD